MPGFVVPPGGFAGFSQMMPASRAALFPTSRGAPRAGGRRKRRAKKTARRGKRAKRASSGGGKMKFGSPAWQKKYRVGKFAKKRK